MKVINVKTMMDAHKFSSYNRALIKRSKVCTCFCCLKEFPAEKAEYDYAGEDTAICPYCWTDSVIPEASGVDIFDRDFLIMMNNYWFCGCAFAK